MSRVYQFILSSCLIIVLAIFFLYSPHSVYAGCGKSVSAPVVKPIRGPKSYQITLKWNPVVGANRYSIIYGTQSNKYDYAAVNFGDERTTSFKVDFLKLNFKYYFRVQASDGCDYSPYSEEVSAWPPKRGGGVGMK